MRKDRMRKESEWSRDGDRLTAGIIGPNNVVLKGSRDSI